MKKTRARFTVPALCLLFALSAASILLLYTPALASEQAAMETLDKVSGAFDAAELFYEQLVEIATEVAEDEEAAEDALQDSEEELDVEAFEADIQELRDIVDQLEELRSELSGLPDDISTSEGKTVQATREYIAMLNNMALDLIELAQYSMDIYLALIILEEMDVDVPGLQEMAEVLWDITNETLERLEDIKAPVYLETTHQELIKRMTEFNDLAVDFYKGAELDDPLRINSCIQRLGYIGRMFEKCEENLMGDIDLQSRQAESRISGPITLLHDELAKNISLLKAG